MLTNKSNAPKATKKLYKQLYFQVLVGIFVGVVVGALNPTLGVKLKPLGDAFIKLVTMVIGPIIFCTIVSGIGKMGDMKSVGRIGVKSLFYFEVVSTIALLVGLVIVNILKPGVGVNVDVNNLDASTLSAFASKASSAQSLDTISFIMNIIPQNVIQAFAENNLLQILFFAVIFGLALSKIGKQGEGIVKLVDQICNSLFGVIDFIMKLSPIGAFGAMAYTVGAYGTDMLLTLSKFMLCVYFACFVFIAVVLGVIAKMFKFSLLKLIKHLKDELLIVIGTSCSESVLPHLMNKMEKFGCDKAVTGMVIPTGYSFNLDGTSLYLTMAAVFLAQALGIDLTLSQQLTIVGILFITSKGAAAVSGGGFIVLVSTLAILDIVPSSSAAILIGIDRFMSQARAVTNLIGNGVAAVVVAKWENAFKAEPSTSYSDIPDLDTNAKDTAKNKSGKPVNLAYL